MPFDLPLLSPTTPLRLTPTDVTLFARLEQCERYLRFRLAERVKQKFMEPYDVTPQRIAPLLSLSGSTFETDVGRQLPPTFQTVNYATEGKQDHNRKPNNTALLTLVRAIPIGQTRIVLQPRVEAEVGGWQLRGDIDLIRFTRTATALQIILVDMKSTVEVKVEHRLQVAFYRLMLEQLLQSNGISHELITLGILYRPPIAPSEDDLATVAAQRQQARDLLGLENALLEIITDPEGYIQAAYDLVLADNSVARRIAQRPFADLPYCLSAKCDGCLYNEFCMKWSAEHEDLSLLPYMTPTDKEALRRFGITKVKDLADLKTLSITNEHVELVVAPEREAVVKQIAATWSVGPRLDELIHRAKNYRSVRCKDGTKALGYIPSGLSTLPASTPDVNPNLVRIYLDAQHDYLEGRIYLLSALVVACKEGIPVHRRAIVKMTAAPPEMAAHEQQLFIDWTRELGQAIVELATSSADVQQPKEAPIHVIFFERHVQRVLLEGLARNFPPILEQTPPLYDFLTQIAAFDSPIASYLDEELQAAKNLPLTCPSLQSVAQFMRFDWNTPQPFRDLFKARLFDNVGKLELDGKEEWFTRRARFNSSIPLEYAYAAWQQLPPVVPKQWDEFQPFRAVSHAQLLAFQGRRLEAIEHIASSFKGNPNTAKTPFVLPDLADFDDKATDLAQALHEFVTIERLVELNAWKSSRHVAPERRALQGDCLVVQYCEADQAEERVVQNRTNETRRRLREGFVADFKTKNPEKRFRATKEQKEASDWSHDGDRFKLRISTNGIDCDLHELLLLSNFKPGARLVLMPRWTTDERLPSNVQQQFTPSPKQLLYAQRVDLVALHTSKDASGRVVEALAEIEMQASRGSQATQPFVFGAFARPLDPEAIYTLDPSPDDWYGYWCKKVIDGLCAHEPNILYERLTAPMSVSDDQGLPGQRAFLQGLDAFHDAGLLHAFEPGKRTFISGHGTTPLLLVQGPPGTGKSYSTAFAVFARLQAALTDQRPYRVFVTCKTHAATDVLLANILDVQLLLRKLHAEHPDLFATYFAPALLEVPLIRLAPQDPVPEGIIPLVKDNEKDDAADNNLTELDAYTHAIVAITPGGTYSLLKAAFDKHLFGHELCDLLVLDEASQMNLPEALMAALPLKREAPLIVVGDHRQMPPIVKHDWDNETRRTFQQFQVYDSLFDTLRARQTPLIQFSESFRLHAAMADFLREEVYRHDGIAYHSRRHEVLPPLPIVDPFVAAVLRPEYPLIVVTHTEAASQVRNEYEQTLVDPILRTLADPALYNLQADEGLGIVVPHRAQRAALQQAFPTLCLLDPTSGLPLRSAIDTVERFQGGERTVILVSATESERAYLLASSTFLLDPRRLTVAISRAKRKMILVAADNIFSLFSPDTEIFANAQLWKNLRRRACPVLLWEGIHASQRVQVWGGPSDS